MDVPYFKGTAYKFMSIDGLLATIENKTLRFTRGDMFNDPFESNPYLVPLEWGGEIPTFTENPDLHFFLYNQTFKRIFASLYITCSTKEYKDEESKLMWSNYASNHSGVCIEINLKREHGNFIVPLSVQYTNSLLEERNKRTPNSDDLALFLSINKSNIWSYEKEIRIVLEKEGYEKHKETTLNTTEDSKHLYLPFELFNIKRIIFGVNSLKTDSIKIVDALIQHKEMIQSPNF